MIRVFHFISLCLALGVVQAQSVQSPTGQEIPLEVISQFLQQQMQATQTPGLSCAIINSGEIAAHMELGKASPNREVTEATIFEGASLSKPLFAYFTMGFVEEGLLDLDTPLHTYHPYPDIAHDARYQNITGRHVLSHQTGFPNWRTDTPGDSLYMQFDPGTRFQYSGEGFQYLALALQSILKTDAKGLQKRFHERVAQPLGLEVTRFIQNQKNLKNKADAYKNDSWQPFNDFGDQEFGAAYGIHSNAVDFARWIIALMNQKGLSEASYAELFRIQTELPEENLNRQTGITGMTLGFYTGQLPIGRFYGHGGNNDKRFTSLFFFDPTTQWGAVLFTNSGAGEEMGLAFLNFLATYTGQ